MRVVIQEFALTLQQSVQDIIETTLTNLRVLSQRHEHMQIALLPDTKHPVGALILHRWIPPSRQVNHMICCGKGETDSSRPWRQDHYIERKRATLKLADGLLPSCPRVPFRLFEAVSFQFGIAEDRRPMSFEDAHSMWKERAPVATEQA